MVTRPEHPRGIRGIEILFDQCRRRPGQNREERRRGRELPLIVLLGRRGSGKTATLNWLGWIASTRPHAAYDFASDAPRRPHEVAARLAFGLSYRHRNQPPIRFPRLTLGLIVVRMGLSFELGGSDPRDELRQALRQIRKDGAGENGPVLPEVVALLQDLNLLQFPGATLLLSLVRSGLPRLPVGLLWRTGLAWYGARQEYVGLDALVALNRLHQSETHGDRAAVDRTLCEAFVADLRAHYARYDRDRACVLLLDNIDRNRGRQFLDLLVDIREHATTPDGREEFDPLLVVATASDSGRVPGTFDPASRGLRLTAPEDASYAAWERARPRPAVDPAWRWYPVVLRDLTADEVGKLAESVPRLAGAPPLVHRLTYGHPWSVRRLHDVVRRAIARGDADTALRTVLEADWPSPEADAPPEPFARAALRYLLTDATDDRLAALTTCAAARELDAAVDAGLLDDARHPLLLEEVGARLWLGPPVPEDAGTRGGHGSGYLPERCHPVPLPGRPVLHPWLRLLLLRELATRPAGDAPDWTATHTTLRDWYHTQGQPLDEYYHRLALGELETVVDRLHVSLGTLPDVDAWLYELYAVTAAPSRDPVNPGPPASRRALRLAEELAPRSFRDHRALTVLVTSLWLATDPRNRLPVTAPELNHTIGAMFRELGTHAQPRAAGLLHEAHRYAERA
ncbi:hypothetical protein [Streptomyces specialis]|uniref:hypothetical protein n=1 Tax=Streptomyces specialis TaxID=498367 RepID=UPI00131E3C74|nr:hypothetical protein [Streptomyces specialis]